MKVTQTVTKQTYAKMGVAYQVSYIIFDAILIFRECDQLLNAFYFYFLLQKNAKMTQTAIKLKFVNMVVVNMVSYMIF